MFPQDTSDLAISVRAARPADAARVAAIYNEGIRGRLATFETRDRRPAEIAEWFSAGSGRQGENPHPFLVAETSAEVVGWIRSSEYRSRECYRGIGDFSVYVADSHRGRRIGDRLMAAFLPACEAASLWKLVSRVFPENAGSRALCARHGFREVGTYTRHAQLDGAWRDVVIVERLLGAARES